LIAPNPRAPIRPHCLSYHDHWPKALLQKFPIRADRSAMNLPALFAAAFVLLALTGCAPVAAERGPATILSYPHDHGPDMRSGVM